MSNASINNTDPLDQKGKSLFLIPSDYTVIDLETTGLEPYNDNIIEIACIKYRNNQEIDRFETLVQPPPYYLETDGKPVYVPDFITDLTGITNEMLVDAPPFDSFNQRLYDFLDGELLLGHNVNFDLRFLWVKYHFDYYLPFYNDYVDTLRLSRRILPDLPHHTLTYMVDYYGIKTQHHRALSDCLATHELLLKLAETVYDKKINMEDIAKKKPCDLRTLKCEDVVVNESNFFFEKTCVFTGKLEKFKKEEAAQIVVNLGGKCDNNVNKKTDILVVGGLTSALIKEGKSNKLVKAEQLKAKGKSIHILSEETFYELINDFVS